MVMPPKVTDATRETFLAALSETGNVTMAASAAGLSRQSLYRHRKTDQAFAEAWAEAERIGVEAMEDEAKRRAFAGYEEPVYQGGRRVGEIRRYSDTLATLLLKAHAPEKYRERSDVHLHGALDVRNMSTAELEAEVAAAKLAGLVDGEPDDADPA